LGKAKNREELTVNANISLPDEILESEISLLQSFFPELLKDVLIQMEHDKE